MKHATLRIDDGRDLAVLIGCEIEIDRGGHPDGLWRAHNTQGYEGRADTASGAALICFANHLAIGWTSPPKYCANCGTAIAAPTGCDSCLSLKPNARDSSYQGAHRSPLALLEPQPKGLSEEQRHQLAEIFGMKLADIDVGVQQLEKRLSTDGFEVLRRCELCDTMLEFRVRKDQEPRAMIFTPHRDDPTFCPSVTKDRIAQLHKALRAAALEHAEIAARLRFVHAGPERNRAHGITEIGYVLLRADMLIPARHDPAAVLDQIYDAAHGVER